MKRIKLIAIATILVISILPTGVALAIGDPVGCVAAGGTWTDTGANTGECAFPAGHAVSQQRCGNTAQSVVDYWDASSGDWVLDHHVCSGAAPDGETASTGNTHSGHTANGRNDDTEDQSLNTGHHDAYVNFDSGACPGWCRISSHLPNGIGELPAGTHATLYIHVVDENQDPYAGHYLACFDVTEVNNPIVYQWKAGAWVAVPYSLTDTQICISGTGDGSFAMVHD